jgi:hypothetical protein
MVGLDDFEASEKPGVVDVVAPPTHVDDDLPTALAARRRIRYAGDDEENAGPSSITDLGHTLTRRASTYSVHSLSSVRSGHRTVDPSIILPVQYRTLSYDITNVKAIEKAKDAREKAAVGESHWR